MLKKIFKMIKKFWLEYSVVLKVIAVAFCLTIIVVRVQNFCKKEVGQNFETYEETIEVLDYGRNPLDYNPSKDLVLDAFMLDTIIVKEYEVYNNTEHVKFRTNSLQCEIWNIKAIPFETPHKLEYFFTDEYGKKILVEYSNSSIEHRASKNKCLEFETFLLKKIKNLR
jgi:hypothetical protein